MSVIALALAAATTSTSYDCTLEVPARLLRADGKAEVNAIGFPPEINWKFDLTIMTSESKIVAQVVWPGNPMQIAGKFAALSTGKGAVAFTAFSGGPCLFTETGCLALVQVADQSDGTAKIIVTPSALLTDSAKDSRAPFLVVAEGVCVRKGSSS